MDITVLVPLFNEAGSLQELHKRLTAVLTATGKTYEIIFIDDGSTDSSLDMLKKIRANDSKLKVISFRRNYGKAAALAIGFAEAAGKVVITMDADLQDDPKEIPRFLEKLEEGFDLVSGWKKVRHDPLSKRFLSKFFNWITGLLTGLKIHDANCGFKAYRQEVVKEVHIYGELHRYIPALAHMRGFKTTEIIVEHHARRHGRSKYGMKRLIRGGMDLITVLFMSRYRMRPLHLFGAGGLFVFGIGFIVDIYILTLKIRFGDIQNRAPLLLFGILLTLLGIQIISTGLLAEMITGLVEPKSTNYSIKQKLG